MPRHPSPELIAVAVAAELAPRRAELVKTGEAMEIAKVTRRTLRLAALKGELTAYLDGNLMKLDARQVRRWAAERSEK